MCDFIIPAASGHSHSGFLSILQMDSLGVLFSTRLQSSAKLKGKILKYDWIWMSEMKRVAWYKKAINVLNKAHILDYPLVEMEVQYEV